MATDRMERQRCHRALQNAATNSVELLAGSFLSKTAFYRPVPIGPIRFVNGNASQADRKPIELRRRQSLNWLPRRPHFQHVGWARYERRFAHYGAKDPGRSAKVASYPALKVFRRYASFRVALGFAQPPRQFARIPEQPFQTPAEGSIRLDLMVLREFIRTIYHAMLGRFGS
jgi:hypothetical protein